MDVKELARRDRLVKWLIIGCAAGALATMAGIAAQWTNRTAAPASESLVPADTDALSLARARFGARMLEHRQDFNMQNVRSKDDVEAMLVEVRRRRAIFLDFRTDLLAIAEDTAFKDTDMAITEAALENYRDAESLLLFLRTAAWTDDGKGIFERHSEVDQYQVLAAAYTASTLEVERLQAERRARAAANTHR